MKNIFLALSKRVDLFILLLCLGLSYGIWQLGIRSDYRDTKYLQEVTGKVSDELNNEISHVFHYVNGVVGLYESSDNVTDQELSNFLKVVNRNNYQASLLRVGYVQANQVNDELQMKVTQVVDQTGKIYVPSGRDLMQDETMKTWIPKMMVDGRGRVEYSPKIQNVAEYSGDGFIFSEPVYRDGKYVGLINGVVSRQAVAEMIDKLVPAQMEWKWQMGQDLTLSEASTLNGIVLKEQAIIDLSPDAQWTIEIMHTQLPSTYWNIVLAVGIFVSFVIYTAVYGLSTANVRAEIMAANMTTDLKKYKLALDSASNHVVITDPEGVVIYVNPAAQKLTGYSLDEIKGQTPRLWGKQMSPEYYSRFWETIKTERKIFRGEFNNKRKNGELYIAQATVSPIVAEDGELLGFVGVEEDVTEANRIAREKAMSIEKLAKFNELMVGRELKMTELKKEIALLKKEKE